MIDTADGAVSLFLVVSATAECDIAVVRLCSNDCQVEISQAHPHDHWMLQTAKLNSTDSKLQGTLSKAWVSHNKAMPCSSLKQQTQWMGYQSDLHRTWCLLEGMKTLCSSILQTDA